MKIQGAVIKEQGVTFAIVIVKKTVIDSRTEANNAIVAFRPIFPGIPLVLMAQDHRGVPTYYGRQDIAKFMANVPMHVIPWKEYTIG
jgi:hypothetical protein